MISEFASQVIVTHEELLKTSQWPLFYSSRQVNLQINFLIINLFLIYRGTEDKINIFAKKSLWFVWNLIRKRSANLFEK